MVSKNDGAANILRLPGKVDYYPIDDLKMDTHIYQRKQGRKVLRYIIDHLNTFALQQILLSRRADGSLWIIDGGHETLALRHLFGNISVECRVYEGLTKRQEVEIFRCRNRWRYGIKAQPDFRADVFLEEPGTLKIIEICGKEGLPYRMTDKKETWCEIDNPNPLKSVMKLYGEEVTALTLRVIYRSFNGDDRATNARSITGMAAFLHHCRDHEAFKVDKVVNRLRSIGLNAIIDKTAIVNSNTTFKGDRAFAKAAMDLYNEAPGQGNPKIYSTKGLS